MNMHLEESSKDTVVIEKDLDISEGAEFAEVSVEVPPTHHGGDSNKFYKYTVKVQKEKMTASLVANSFADFWKEVEAAVLEDINKV